MDKCEQALGRNSGGRVRSVEDPALHAEVRPQNSLAPYADVDEPHESAEQYDRNR